MTNTKAAERFAALQSKAQQTAAVVRDMRITLAVKYGEARTYYMSAGERSRLAKVVAAQDKAESRFFAFLATVQGRDFSVSVPCHWIVSSLTFADATTTGPMTAVPPPAFGYTERVMREFAGHV